MKKSYPLLAATLIGILLSVYAAEPPSERQRLNTADTRYFNAQVILFSLACPLPKGISSFKPIYHLKQDDLKTQALAREYVELKRRETQASWQSAAQYFNQDQYLASQWKTRMQTHLNAVEQSMQSYRKSDYLFAMPLDEYVQSQADQYQYACKHYRQVQSEWTTREQALKQLRQEKRQPWLSADRPLTCSILMSKHCYDD